MALHSRSCPARSGVCNFFAAAQDEDGGDWCRPDRITETWSFASRRRASELYELSIPPNERAQGRPDAGCTRGMRRKMTTGSTGATRPSLRDWFTAYTCSPRRAGLSSHRRLPGQRPCRLDPSVGQRRGIRTTRFCRPPRPCSSVTASASIASRLNVRDDASAPLGRAGMAPNKPYFSENRKLNIFLGRP